MSTAPLRYQLPKRAIKGDCPQCGPRHRRTLSRYVDTRTGELLPSEYGRCDRENNCTYHLSPYHKGPSGISYADGVFEQFKTDNPLPERRSTERPSRQPSHQLRPATLTPPPFVHAIPDEIFERSLGHYDHNQFAALLRTHFGADQATALLHRFCIGTSAHWPGATVFWLVDMNGRARGGQVNLFTDDWHRARFMHRGIEKVCITSVSHGLLRHYRYQGEEPPEWLTDYHQNAEKWPIPFGLHQLRDAPADQPVAIVEACKTAVICAGYYPQFVWLAIGGKSYLKAERLASLKNRRIMFYPDLNAYHDTMGKNDRPIKGWLTIARELQQMGFAIEVSSLLEDLATDEQKRQGLDLADFLLAPQVEPAPPTFQPEAVQTMADWQSKPGSILRPNPDALTYL